MKITYEFLHAGATPCGPWKGKIGGAWNSDQLALIGIEWPPRHGWMKDVIGREISDADAALFVSLKGLKKKKRRAKLPELLDRAHLSDLRERGLMN